MTAYECWQEQREALGAELAKQQDLQDVIFAVRHALLQTEQNVLASQNDDVLRQQMGVLFALLKNSISLVKVPLTSTTWTAASRRNEKRLGRGFPLLLCASFLLLAGCLWSYAKSDLLGWLLPLYAALLAVIGLWICHTETKKNAAPTKQSAKVTHSVDVQILLSTIDTQILMIDRCRNDFAYLNQTLRTATDRISTKNLEAIADLLEAIYACDDDLRLQAEDAMNQLLDEMGLEAIVYSPEHGRLFNQLPSMNTTRTLCPAILSAEDHRLLRRGTAVVATNAA